MRIWLQNYPDINPDKKRKIYQKFEILNFTNPPKVQFSTFVLLQTSLNTIFFRLEKNKIDLPYLLVFNIAKTAKNAISAVKSRIVRKLYI